jgi:hypothetical protein
MERQGQNPEKQASRRQRCNACMLKDRGKKRADSGWNKSHSYQRQQLASGAASASTSAATSTSASAQPQVGPGDHLRLEGTASVENEALLVLFGPSFPAPTLRRLYTLVTLKTPLRHPHRDRALRLYSNGAFNSRDQDRDGEKGAVGFMTVPDITYIQPFRSQLVRRFG